MNIFKKLLNILFGKNKRDSNHINSQIEDFDVSDMSGLIRSLKLSIVLGDIKLNPKLSVFSKKDIELLRYVSDLGFYVGGSYVLRLYGLMERDSNDLDIFGDVEMCVENGIINKKNVINKTIGDYGRGDVRYKIRTDKGVLDIFQKKDIINIESVEGINFNSPFMTLEAKSNYGRYKDYKDFLFIKNKFNL